MRVLFINGPTQDVDSNYDGWPTSLLLAISPSVDAMRFGDLDATFDPILFDPVKWKMPNDDSAIVSAFEARLESTDVICASVTYDSLWPVLRLFHRAKEFRPDIVTILGGPQIDEAHQVLRFHESEKHRDAIDFTIGGDADFALVSLLRGLAAGRMTPMTTRPESGRGIFSTYCRGVLVEQGSKPVNLDSLPHPPIELADTPARRNNLSRLLGRPDLTPCVETIAQRGCSYACEWCSERKMSLNRRSIDSIIAEVELRKRQGFKMVFFNDSTFGLYRPIRELLSALQQTGMKFGCLNRFDLLDNPAIIDAYRQAGFVYFYCAIEQFDDLVLRRMTKSGSTERIERALRLLYERSVTVGVSLLYGLPGESQCSIQRTIDFVEEWMERGVIRLVSQSVLSLHPGTPMGMELQGNYDCSPPNRGFPFNQFEQGQWYHPPHVTRQYLEWIASESRRRIGHVLVRR